MQNYIAPGENITVPAPAEVSSGDLVVVGALVGVASTDAASGADVVISTDGIFELPKKTTDDVAVGDKLYWDATNGYLTKTAGTGSKPLVGAATKAAGGTATTVEVNVELTYQTGPA